MYVLQMNIYSYFSHNFKISSYGTIQYELSLFDLFIYLLLLNTVFEIISGDAFSSLYFKEQ